MLDTVSLRLYSFLIIFFSPGQINSTDLSSSSPIFYCTVSKLLLSMFTEVFISDVTILVLQLSSFQSFISLLDIAQQFTHWEHFSFKSEKTQNNFQSTVLNLQYFEYVKICFLLTICSLTVAHIYLLLVFLIIWWSMCGWFTVRYLYYAVFL